MCTYINNQSRILFQKEFISHTDAEAVLQKHEGSFEFEGTTYTISVATPAPPGV